MLDSNVLYEDTEPYYDNYTGWIKIGILLYHIQETLKLRTDSYEEQENLERDFL